ncbi:MAG: LTA synthase family protein [Peptococcaceae bacterium]|nr:LTA synthase family protein [Peptococcaceae bacterium]
MFAASFLIVFLGLFVYCLIKDIITIYGDMQMGELVFFLYVPMDMGNTDFVPTLIMNSLFSALIGVAILVAVLGSWYKHAVVIQIPFLKNPKKLSLFPPAFVFLRRHPLAVACAVTVVLSVVALGKLGFVNSFAYSFVKSTFIEDNYIDPRAVNLVFPEQKKNLIYIMLESIENTYVSHDEGGGMSENLIPELTTLARKHTSFSNTDSFCGGAVPLYSCTFTIGSTVGQTSGMPFTLPLDNSRINSLGDFVDFLPGAYSIGEILDLEGYHQVYAIGSGAAFAGRDKYFTQHGNYTIKDYGSAPKDDIIPEDYHVWWGMEDVKLYDYAKQELLILAAADQPFNLTMLTVDTHAVGGYVCELCPEKYDDQYANVIACASRQLGAFVQWIQGQDFYQDTVIVICGDHNSVDAGFFKELAADYQRTTYNVFINSFAEESNQYNRTFSPLDMFPTTLAAMGVTIPGEQLGLGVNLFSGAPTILEQYGVSYVNTELAKRSDFYFDRICRK